MFLNILLIINFSIFMAIFTVRVYKTAEKPNKVEAVANLLLAIVCSLYITGNIVSLIEKLK